MVQQIKKVKRALALLLSLCLALGLLPGTGALAAGSTLVDGCYEGSGTGRNGEIVLSLTIQNGLITAIDVVSQQETPRYWQLAKRLLRDIADANSPEIDGVSGATLSSKGIKAAVRDALAKADGSLPGAGSAESPIVIRTGAQLQRFAALVDAGDPVCVGACVELGADLDLEGIAFNPIGQEGEAAAKEGRLFAGQFDGKGFTISNLSIQGDYEGGASLGLFSALADSARVQNVKLAQLSILGRESGNLAGILAGGIAGDTAGSSGTGAAVVDGCTVSGSVSLQAADGQACAGGILGRAGFGAAVVNCVFDGQVSASAEGRGNGAYAGGLAGRSEGAVLANNAAFGSVCAENLSGGSDACAGGLTGLLDGRLWGSYALVSAAIAQKQGAPCQYVGALAGGNASDTGADCYYSAEASLKVRDEAGAEHILEARPWELDGAGAQVCAEVRPAADLGGEGFAALLNSGLQAVHEALKAQTPGLRTWVQDGARVLPSGELWEPEQPEEPERPQANPFEDVQEGRYFYKAVLWAVNASPQITKGTAETAFSPDLDCTRGQIVTFLWRAAGAPEPRGEDCAFTDLDKGAFYYKAVLWAVENGITAGTTATRFSPQESCTRAQIVTFLYRYAGSPKIEGGSCPFTDVKEGSFYYRAVLWAVGTGVTTGTGQSSFSPGKTCTRGEAVTFLYRLVGQSASSAAAL